MCTLIITTITTAIPSYGTILINYTGDALPEDSMPPFEFTQGRTVGQRSVEDGILTIVNPDGTGSQVYERKDPMLVGELMVQQFRARLIDPPDSTATLFRGAVTHFEFGDEVNPSVGILVFVVKDNVILRQLDRSGNSTTFIQDQISLNTQEFHTYTLVRDPLDGVELYVDGVLRIEQANSPLGAPWRFGSTQFFQANPSVITEWDYLRYAIGDDALDLVPIPEPGTCISFLTGLAFFGLTARSEVRNEVRNGEVRNGV